MLNFSNVDWPSVFHVATNFCPLYGNCQNEQKNKKLEELLIHEVKGIDKNLNENVLKLLTLENSVKSKKSYGGTSFENIKKMIKKFNKYV